MASRVCPPESDPYDRGRRRRLLEDRLEHLAGIDLATDPGRALGRQVSDLDTALIKDRYRIAVRPFAGFWSQFDRFARRAI